MSKLIEFDPIMTVEVYLGNKEKEIEGMKKRSKTSDKIIFVDDFGGIIIFKGSVWKRA